VSVLRDELLLPCRSLTQTFPGPPLLEAHEQSRGLGRRRYLLLSCSALADTSSSPASLLSFMYMACLLLMCFICCGTILELASSREQRREDAGSTMTARAARAWGSAEARAQKFGRSTRVLPARLARSTFLPHPHTLDSHGTRRRSLYARAARRLIRRARVERVRPLPGRMLARNCSHIGLRAEAAKGPGSPLPDPVGCRVAGRRSAGCLQGRCGP
jgi:hypothetical protein